MSHKVEKPVLSGQRIKTRKRDEKEKHDPIGFRNVIIETLEKFEDNVDFEAIYKQLDSLGGKLDYKRYGECLFDILIGGDIFANSGSSISKDNDGLCGGTRVCVFGTASDPLDFDELKNWEQVIVKLMRRYKYLEVLFHDEIRKVLTFLKCYSNENRAKLAVMMYLWISNGSVPFAALSALNNPNLIKDNLAVDFLVDIMKAWSQDKGVKNLQSAIKKANFESHLGDFVGSSSSNQTYFRNLFMNSGLSEILKLYDDQHLMILKRSTQQVLTECLKMKRPMDELLSIIKDPLTNESISESDMICITWTALMNSQEWSKKGDLMPEQVLRCIIAHSPLFEACSTQERSETALLLKVQEFCHTNMNFRTLFAKIVNVFYKKGILSEVTIRKWYISGKVKQLFLEQIKEFIEWLENAEEESDSESDENDN